MKNLYPRIHKFILFLVLSQILIKFGISAAPTTATTNKFIELSVHDEKLDAEGVLFFLISDEKNIPNLSSEKIQVSSTDYAWYIIPKNATGFQFKAARKGSKWNDIIPNADQWIKFSEITGKVHSDINGQHIYVSIHFNEAGLQPDINKTYLDEFKEAKRSTPIHRLQSASVKSNWCYMGEWDKQKGTWTSNYFINGSVSSNDLSKRKIITQDLAFLNQKSHELNNRSNENNYITRPIITPNFPMKLRNLPTSKEDVGVLRPGVAVSFVKLKWYQRDSSFYIYVLINNTNK